MFPLPPAYGCNKLSGCYLADSSHAHDQAWGFLEQNLPKNGQGDQAVTAQVASGEMKFQIFHSNYLRPQELMT